MTNRNLHSTRRNMLEVLMIVNIPYPHLIVRYVRDLYAGNFIPALDGILSNCNLFVMGMMVSTQVDRHGLPPGANQSFHHGFVH